MITSTFGRLFLDAYNERYGTNYDAKTFFVEQYWPLFFDHCKYMMWAQNSPFVQMKSGQKVETLTSDERREKLNDLLSKVCRGAKDASVALGYAASDEKEFATTSGQVTDMQMVNDEAEIYLSWIGASLAIGVKGGLSILFNNKDILLDTFEGWKVYRDALESNDRLKGNQISSWNGLWLVHRYDKLLYRKDFPMADFDPFEAKEGDGMSVGLSSWIKVLASIAQTYKVPKMLGYVFNFGQTNTTIGFIPFSLEPIRRTAQIYKQLFRLEEYRNAEELFGTAVGLQKSCQMGAVGIRALEPKGLMDFIKGTTPKEKDLKNEIKIHTYITWILAMLDNQKLWEEAQTIASALKAFSESGEKGRTDRSNKAKDVLSSTNKRNFIVNLTEVVMIDAKEEFVDAAKLVNEMPADNVPYFLTLIRFQYATIKNQ